MKKINVILCAIIACTLSACDDFCGFSHGEPHTRYKWSYTNKQRNDIVG